MIQWIVCEVAERAGINNASELAKRSGLQPTSVYRIWKGEAARADLRTLDKLCTLLEVKPSQLFDQVAEPDRLPKVGPIKAKPRTGKISRNRPTH